MTSPRVETHLPRHEFIAVRRFTANRATPRAPVVHDHASVALYLEGGATFWMQGLYTLGPGDLLLVPDATPHYLLTAGSARAIGASLCLSCAPPAVRDSLRALFDAVRRGGCAKRHLQPGDAERVEQLLLEVERERGRQDDGSPLALQGLLMLLTAAVLRASTAGRTRKAAGANPVVARALEYVHRHGSSGISLRDVARHVGRTPAHVASLVKQATGDTVVGWITRARMSECRQLLQHTEDSVEVVAARCGFASASHFHRAFRRVHGMPPGEWRRLHRS